MKSVYGIVCLVLLLSACGGEDSQDEHMPSNEEDDELLSLIHSNMEKWQVSGIENYSFTYYVAPSDCPAADPLPPRVITVEASSVVSVYVPALGSEEDVNNNPTIDDIFVSMLEMYQSNPEVFSEKASDSNSLPTFDDQYGFPLSYFIDISDAECDGYTYLLSDFQ